MYLRQKRVIIDFAQTKRAIDVSGLCGVLYLCTVPANRSEMGLRYE